MGVLDRRKTNRGGREEGRADGSPHLDVVHGNEGDSAPGEKWRLGVFRGTTKRGTWHQGNSGDVIRDYGSSGGGRGHEALSIKQSSRPVLSGAVWSGVVVLSVLIDVWSCDDTERPGTG